MIRKSVQRFSEKIMLNQRKRPVLVARRTTVPRCWARYAESPDALYAGSPDVPSVDPRNTTKAVTVERDYWKCRIGNRSS